MSLGIALKFKPSALLATKSSLCFFKQNCVSSSQVIGRFYSTKEKLSYFNLPGSEPLLGQTVGNVIDKSADVYGSREAYVNCLTKQRKNFSQLKEDVDKFAAGLLSLGLKRGDRIGIWSPNNYEWVLTQYATAKAGLILVMINPAYQAKELEYCLGKVGIKAVISAETFKTQNYYDMLKSIIPTLPNSKPGQIQDKLKNLTHIIMISDKDFGGTFKFSDVANAGQNSHFEELEKLQNEIQFDDPVNIQFTSGTTGNPKGATLSHFNIVNNAGMVGRRLKYHEKPHRICINVPLYHCFGCVIGSMAGVMFGACQVYPAPTFNAAATAKAVHEEKCTSFYGTPTMFIDVLNLPNLKDYDFSYAFTGVMAGSTCPIEILKSAMTTLNLHEICVCYGCTETSPVITQSSPDDSVEKRATTVGTVLEHTELKIVDPHTKCVVPCGKPGELWTRGYLVMLGYWDDEKNTKEAITSDGWYKTGDLAEADENGYVKIIGRIKDMIIRGGENVYPREIEELLHINPKIAEAHVVGVPDARMGEEVCAWIKLKEGEMMTEQDVKQFCKGKISHFKIPRYIKFVDTFPTTVTGKIKKFAIREEMCKELKLK